MSGTKEVRVLAAINELMKVVKYKATVGQASQKLQTGKRFNQKINELWKSSHMVVFLLVNKVQALCY